MKARDLIIEPCGVDCVRNFIETHHYSKSINGVRISQCFKVTYSGVLVGAVLFGQMSTTAWKKFSDSEEKVLELRRLVLVDGAEKNSESRVIGFCLRWLKSNSAADVVVSYADPSHGHSGVIYKASNFTHIGMSGKDFGYKHPSGKIYHSRALRVKYNGDFKPYVKELRRLLSLGMLEKIPLPPKHCFVYPLKKQWRLP